MKYLFFLLLLFVNSSWGQELNNPNKLKLCPEDKKARHHNCWGSIELTEAEEEGDKYIGEFVNSNFNGLGTYIYSTGRKYIGEFRKGKFHGSGIMISRKGNKLEGIWSNGEFVRDEKVNLLILGSQNKDQLLDLNRTQESKNDLNSNTIISSDKKWIKLFIAGSEEGNEAGSTIYFETESVNGGFTQKKLSLLIDYPTPRPIEKHMMNSAVMKIELNCSELLMRLIKIELMTHNMGGGTMIQTIEGDSWRKVPSKFHMLPNLVCSKSSIE